MLTCKKVTVLNSHFGFINY